MRCVALDSRYDREWRMHAHAQTCVVFVSDKQTVRQYILYYKYYTSAMHFCVCVITLNKKNIQQSQSACILRIYAYGDVFERQIRNKEN